MFYIFNFSLNNPVFVSARSATEEEIKDDMGELEKKLKKAENDYGKLSQQYQQILKFIETAQKEINKTNSLISGTKEEISRKEKEIELLGKRIEIGREIMKKILQQIYFSKKSFFSNLASREGKFSRLEGNSEYLANLEDKLGAIMEDINRSKQEINKEKENLEEDKEDHEKLLAIKENQKQDLLVAEQEIQEDIQSKEKTISQLQSKLNNMRSEYSRILGKSINTSDILEAAKFAANATGMNKSFLLGVLIQESNKGQSVGGCDYKSSKMTSTQLSAFRDICEELDYNYKKQPVSCPPSKYKGTGGAMGVPQFMPTTWAYGGNPKYKTQIASLTGHNPPDPWNLLDGVTAMAIKLSADGANKKTRFAEAKSYCVYLAGGNWGYYCFGTDKYKKSYENVNCWGSSIRNYGEKVLCLKDNYEKYY